MQSTNKKNERSYILNYAQDRRIKTVAENIPSITYRVKGQHGEKFRDISLEEL
jgi:hypothetical protein